MCELTSSLGKKQTSHITLQGSNPLSTNIAPSKAATQIHTKNKPAVSNIYTQKKTPKKNTIQ